MSVPWKKVLSTVLTLGAAPLVSWLSSKMSNKRAAEAAAVVTDILAGNPGKVSQDVHNALHEALDKAIESKTAKHVESCAMDAVTKAIQRASGQVIDPNLKLKK